MLVRADSETPFEAVDSTTLLQEVLNDVTLQHRAVAFLQRERAPSESPRKTVVVQQREYAQVRLDEEAILESDAATTCLLAVAVCSIIGHAAIAHFDDVSTDAFERWIGAMKEPRVYLVGDYVKREHHQESIAAALLWFLRRHPRIKPKLELACIRECNTKSDGYPATYALSFDCSTNTAYPSPTSTTKPPAWIERAVALFQTAVINNIYDTDRGMLHFTGFRVHRPVHLRGDLRLSDKQIVLRCSTSPRHEPANFASDMRACWQWMAELTQQELHRQDQWFEWRGHWQKTEPPID